jgi:two-component system LytT family sensor kinase
MGRMRTLDFVMAAVTKKRFLYWIAQLSGWLFYVFLAALSSYVNDKLDSKMSLALFIVFVLGIVLSHLYKRVILRMDWLNLSIGKALPRVFITAIIFSQLMAISQPLLREFVLDPDPNPPAYSPAVQNMLTVLNWLIIWLMWTLIYFAFHYFEKSRKEEIKNLQWEASKNEIELNNLKAQLNPHFMFNSMNSIRALIEEDPEQAKQSITQLSTILRNTLLMGKKKLILVEEELVVIRDYLALESIRYEERLKVEYQVDDSALKCCIPPLMIQTLVENGIKHGISKLTEGGLLSVILKADNGYLNIRIENSGEYKPEKNAMTGIGLNNTRKRLELLYGNDADLAIYNENGMVITNVTLPKQTEYESNSN